MNSEQNHKLAVIAFLTSAASFAAISLTLFVLVNQSFEFGFLFSSTVVGVITYGFAMALTSAFGKKATDTLCYLASCAFVSVAFLAISAIGRWNELQPVFFLIMAIWGIIPGLIGSVTARCIRRQIENNQAD